MEFQGAIMQMRYLDSFDPFCSNAPTVEYWHNRVIIHYKIVKVTQANFGFFQKKLSKKTNSSTSYNFVVICQNKSSKKKQKKMSHGFGFSAIDNFWEKTMEETFSCVAKVLFLTPPTSA